MIHRCKPSTIIFVLLMLCASSFAQAAEDAYSVRIPVDSQQPEVRTQAMAKAMAQVLTRATGRDDITQSPAVAPLLEQPGRFIQRYQYESTPGGLVLSMHFDAAAVRRGLGERGVPTWMADRPPVLVWLAVEQNARRQIVGGEDGAAIRARLQDAAARRGVLLVFPLMDAEDQQKVGPADIFGGFTERVRQAAARYGAPALAIGRMHREGSGWVTRWALSGAANGSWGSTGNSQAEALDAAAADLAGRLVQRFAQLPSAGDSEQTLVVRVQGVNTLRDYDRLERRLRTVGGVGDVWPLALEPDSVVLQLMVQTSPARVLGVLDNDRLLRRLAPVQNTAGAMEPQGVQELVYRLIP